MGQNIGRGTIDPGSREREMVTMQVREHILRRAVSDDNIKQMRLMIRYIDTNMTLASGETLLIYAIKNLKCDIVACLIQNGADLGRLDETGAKPLQTAVTVGDVDMVKLLVDHNAPLEDTDHSGLTALQLACNKGYTEIVSCLIEAGARVDAMTRNKDKKTALVIAASCGMSECMRVLLDNGANPDSQDMWGFTALAKSTINNQLECAEVLLEYEADFNLANRSGATPLQYAAMRNHCDILALLLKYGANVKRFSADIPPISASVLNGCSACTKQLLDHGSDLEKLDKQRKSPLFNATADFPKIEHLYHDYPLTPNKTRPECVRILIEAGADVSKLWKSKFWELRNRSHDQLLTYKMVIRASGMVGVAVVVLPGLFHKLSMFNCVDSMILLCSAGFLPSALDLKYLVTNGNDYNCRCCHQSSSAGSGTKTAQDILNDLGDKLRHLQFNAPALKQLCRLKLRAQMSRNVIYHTKKMAISDDLRDFICINDPKHYIERTSLLPI